MPEQFCRGCKSWPCPFIRWGIWNDPHYPDTQNKLCLQWRLFPRPSPANHRRQVPNATEKERCEEKFGGGQSIT
jgi:hypothetical protein